MREFAICPVACILILAFGVSVNQAEEPSQSRAKARISWLEDHKAAVEQARKSNKPTIVYVTAEYCGYCRKMDREVWSTNDVIETINANFVALRIDAEEHEKLVAQLDVRAYPTTLVFDAAGKHITMAEGFLSRSDLLKLLAKRDSVAKQDE